MNAIGLARYKLCTIKQEPYKIMHRQCSNVSGVESV